MRRYLAPVSAVMLALISVSVFALGLGDIRLNSYLNQRLDAEIELVSASTSELTTLEIRLANREQFERYGLERLPVLNTLNFQVVRRPNGTAYIHVTSKEVIQEPFLTLLVEARWAQGRLLREYTLLLDPPTFADSREAAKVETAETAPVIEPEVVAADSMPETAVEPLATSDVEPAPVMVAEPEVETTVETSGDVIDVPTLEEDLADAGVDAAPAAIRQADDSMSPSLGGTYGEIKRNETLWGISARLRPDDSISMNQMMLAIYRANPEAFYGNINRMKQGYILRIPEYSEVTSLSQREAFLEAKRMNEEWQAGSMATVDYAAPVEEEEPSLSLVAPEEEVTEPDFGDAEITDEADTFDSATETGIDDLGAADEEFTAETGDDADAGAIDLGVEETTDDRLTDVESETLQAMQDSTVDDAVEAESVEVPTLPEDAMAVDELTTEDATAEPETATGDMVAAEDDTMAVEEPVVEAEPTPVQTAPVVRGSKSGLLGQVIEFATSIVGMAVLGGVVVLVLITLLMLRKRRAQSAARAAVGFDDWMADEEDSDVTIVAGDHATAPTETGADEDDVTAVFSHGMEHKDTGTQRLEDDEEATQLLREAEEKTQVVTPQDEGGAGDFGGTQMLDENDPLSEADFHMAYGLYDQAAEVISKAIKNDPGRKDLKVRLAEIHFAANNTSEFVAAAEALKAVVGAGDSDWSNIAIMGKQIAPQNPLFAGSAGGGGSVDLDFEAAAEADSAPAEDSLDFDVLSSSDEPASQSAPSAAATPAASTDDGLDFDLDIGGGDDESYDAEATMVGLADHDSAGESPADDSGMDFDMDIGGGDAADEPAAAASLDDESTQTEFDKALEELSAFVDTNLPESNAGDATQDDSDLNLDEYSFDESDAGSESSDDSGGDSLGEVGTKLDLARAYIDMGDPDGARGILEEVIADGDDQQKAEAQSLLDQIG